LESKKNRINKYSISETIIHMVRFSREHLRLRGGLIPLLAITGNSTNPDGRDYVRDGDLSTGILTCGIERQSILCVIRLTKMLHVGDIHADFPTYPPIASSGSHQDMLS